MTLSHPPNSGIPGTQNHQQKPRWRWSHIAPVELLEACRQSRLRQELPVRFPDRSNRPFFPKKPLFFRCICQPPIYQISPRFTTVPLHFPGLKSMGNWPPETGFGSPFFQPVSRVNFATKQTLKPTDPRPLMFPFSSDKPFHEVQQKPASMSVNSQTAYLRFDTRGHASNH